MTTNRITGQTILRLADDVTFQSLGDGQETVILSLETGTLYTCNETTETFALSRLPTITSGIPSPFKSPAPIPCGAPPQA